MRGSLGNERGSNSRTAPQSQATHYPHPFPFVSPRPSSLRCTRAASCAQLTSRWHPSRVTLLPPLSFPIPTSRHCTALCTAITQPRHAPSAPSYPSLSFASLFLSFFPSFSFHFHPRLGTSIAPDRPLSRTLFFFQSSLSCTLSGRVSPM
jgi:hypothetical protein